MLLLEYPKSEIATLKVTLIFFHACSSIQLYMENSISKNDA
jgi:hypothetical protein